MTTIHRGDTIRFLNSTGGGKVIRIDESRKLAYVEGEDGFIIPTLFSECVVVSTDASADDYSPLRQHKVPTTEYATPDRPKSPLLSRAERKAQEEAKRAAAEKARAEKQYQDDLNALQAKYKK